MSITVRELVEIPGLGLEPVAGADAFGAPLHWAQTCDLEQPWEWMGCQELVMTSGLGVPVAADAQVAYVRGLAQNGLSGVLVATEAKRSLGPAALREADQIGVPVLRSPYRSMGRIPREIADANQREEHGRLIQAMRIYEVFRHISMTSRDRVALLNSLGRELGCHLYVLDVPTGRTWIRSSHPVENGLLDFVHSSILARCERSMPSVLRILYGDWTSFVVPTDMTNRAVLIALSSETEPDLFLLQHAATIAGLEVERLATANERRLRRGMELFAKLLNGGVDAEVASVRLGEFGLEGESLAVAAANLDGTGRRAAEVHCWLREHGVAGLLHVADNALLVLCPDTHTARRVLMDALAPIQVGFSDSLHSVHRVRDAVLEAQWSLETARTQGEPVGRYGTETALFLPRTVSEAETVVRRVLGPVIDYDAVHGGDLMRSLEAFFESDRSWRAAAEGLHVHRQTLVYRIKRIETLTGRDLSSMQDLTEVYLALRARHLLRAD